MKRLLITMGCSMTEGLGCYDLNYDLHSKYQLDRFHEFGWPNRVGKKTGFDKVINLGSQGASNSGQVKMFSEKYLDKDFSEWEVVVIWMLTEPSRFSFYINGKIRDIQIGGSGLTDIEMAYLNLTKDFKDFILEEIFYIKMMEQICENKGYSLLLTGWDDDVHRYTHLLYDTKNYLNPFNLSVRPLDRGEDFKEYQSPVCNHPNEKGYEKMANQIVNNMKKYHSYLVKEPKEDIEWEWDGEIINHYEFSPKEFPRIRGDVI